MRGRLTAMLEEQRGTKARDGFRVLYIAILGSPQGVPVVDAMRFIGPESATARLRAARVRLELRGWLPASGVAGTGGQGGGEEGNALEEVGGDVRRETR